MGTDSGDAERLSPGAHVSATGGRGVLVGDHGVQINYFYPPAQTDGITRAPLVTITGKVDSPYRGLGWFVDKDAPFFYGRERVVEDVLERLSRAVRIPRIVVVSGVSGAGKSSLLRAGVLPRVLGAGLPEIPHARAWPQLVLTPGHMPLDQLAFAAAQHAGIDAASVCRELRERPESFLFTAAQAADSGSDGDDGRDQRILLVVDQFEEVFTQCSDQAQREGFVAALHAAATTVRGTSDTPAAVVVLVMRADFEARFADLPLLEDAVKGRELVTAMTERQLRSVITEPPKRLKARVDAELADQVLRDIRVHSRGAPASSALGNVTGAGILPRVSDALDRAWRNRAAKNTLTVVDYERVGGIESALADAAERVYDALTAERKALARKVFVRLCIAGDDGTDTGDRVCRADLAHLADDVDEVDTVLEPFAGERLLTLDTETVEISHEVLLRTWPRLRDDWLAETHADRAVQTRIQMTAALWRDNGDDEAYLYSGSVLETAVATAARIEEDSVRYAPLSSTEKDFVAKSVARDAAMRERERQQQLYAHRRLRSLRIFVGAMFLVIIVLVGAVVMVVRARSDVIAERQLAWAVTAAKAAERLGVTRSPAENTLAIQLALASYDLSPRDEAKKLVDDIWAGARRWRSGIEVEAVTVSEDSSLLALTDGDTIAVIDRRGPRDGTHHTRLDATMFGGQASAIAFRPDTHLLAVAAGTDVVLVDADEPEQLLTLPGSVASVRDLVWDRNGTELAAATDAGVIRWRFDGRAWQRAEPLSAAIAVDYNGDGRFIATVRPDGSAVELWAREHATDSLRPIGPIALAEQQSSDGLPGRAAGSASEGGPPSGITDIVFTAETRPMLIIVTARDYTNLVSDQQEVAGTLISGGITRIVEGARGLTVGIALGESMIDVYEAFDFDSPIPPDLRSMGGYQYAIVGTAAASAVAVADQGDTFIVTTQDGMVYEWSEPLTHPTPRPSLESIRAAVCADSAGRITAEEWQNLVSGAPLPPSC